MILRSGWSNSRRSACVTSYQLCCGYQTDSAESAKLQAPSTTASFRVSYLKTKAKWKEERLQKVLREGVAWELFL